ncbi:SDR family oxidoreductase [Allorhizocola rhizosphaerae]|uniref:SDR family oxidoreductase n=1 Tax=Allorhizocola rhizosphaerae TaxID=1872709 RepID=UPI000E3BC8FD|nr:SDR family oxidoreductase [Allorhizocola rhizosphaerae]
MIVVTGASGHLGRLVIAELLARGVPADGIVAAVRTPGKAADLDLGVPVREADYDRPETLATAFAGASKVLLISGNEFGKRVAQHTNAINAAKAAGVPFLAYTSILKADTTGIGIAHDHRETERLIRESGLAYTFLRNSWYTENYTDNLGPALATGAIIGSAGDGRVAATTRADYAAAAAAVLAGDGHQNRVYELGSDTPFTMAELAAEVSLQAGTPVSYQDLPAGEYVKALTGFGLDEGYAGALADADLGIQRGELATDSGDLSRLIGRPTASLADAVAAGLKTQ